MSITIEKLNERHLHMVSAFSCIEREEDLQEFNSKERRRIKRHSKDMEDFLKNESLEDQEKGLSTTHLFIDEDKIVAYISLCNDSIGLELEERDEMGLNYLTVPAVKIARLAVDSNYQGHGLGKMLIQFAAYMSNSIRKWSGIVFITLDCYEHRVSFYEGIGFVRNLKQPIKLPYDSPISMRLGLDRYLESIEN